MDHHIIKQIVEEMFEEAKKGSASHAPLALSKYLELETDNSINYKTANRAYKKYVNNDEKIGEPIAETINNFCKFLKYEDYKDYVQKNVKEKTKVVQSSVKAEKKDTGDKKNKKWILTLKITIVFTLTAILYQLLSPNIWKNKNDNKPPIECMTWAKDHYEKTDCDFQLHPDYGTKVDPYDASRSKMRKIEVNASFDFFSEETGQPLVWYFKTKKGTLEYFNLPGLHPVNGETLRKITEGMIEKYVPSHITKPDSFISKVNTNSMKSDIAILVLDGNDFDDRLTSFLKINYLSEKSSIVRLKDPVNYDRNYISNFNPSKELFLNTEVIKADTLVLGVTNYDFHEDKDTKDMIICNLQFDFTFHIQNNKQWKELFTKSINSIGSGYSKTEAKTNAIKKINYE